MMFKKNIYIIFFLFLITSCAKPIVVDVVLPEDKNLNCKQLKDEYLETRRFKKEAEHVQEAQGANATRLVLFWPALFQTLHNADVAIKAANDRAYHVLDIMKKKECKETAKLYSELTKTDTRNVSYEIKRLHQLYKKGILTKEEFEQAKKRVLAE